MNSTLQSLTTWIATGDIRDIHGLLEIPDHPSFFPWVLISLALLAMLGLVAWWRSRSAQQQSPAKVALGKIEAMRELMTPTLSRSFCGGVSDVVRRYIEDQFEVHTTDRTTQEFLASLRDKAPRPLQANQRVLERFLGWCDYAKYAGYRLDARQLEATLGSAIDFVQATCDAVDGDPDHGDQPIVRAGGHTLGVRS